MFHWDLSELVLESSLKHYPLSSSYVSVCKRQIDEIINIPLLSYLHDKVEGWDHKES